MNGGESERGHGPGAEGCGIAAGVTQRDESESDDAGESDGFVDDVAGNLFGRNLAKNVVADDCVKQ